MATGWSSRPATQTNLDTAYLVKEYYKVADINYKEISILEGDVLHPDTKGIEHLGLLKMVEPGNVIDGVGMRVTKNDYIIVIKDYGGNDAL